MIFISTRKLWQINIIFLDKILVEKYIKIISDFNIIATCNVQVINVQDPNETNRLGNRKKLT